MHNFLTTHAIWLIIELGRDLMATHIYTKFGEDRMNTKQVGEQTLLTMFLSYVTVKIV